MSDQKGHLKCDLGKPYREHTPNEHQLFRSVDWIGWMALDGFVSVSDQKGHLKYDLGKPHREHTPNEHQLRLGKYSVGMWQNLAFGWPVA